MNQPTNQLTVEQEFQHRVFADKVQQLSHEQTQELLIQLHQQMLYKDNIYKELLLDRGKDIVDALFAAR